TTDSIPVFERPRASICSTNKRSALPTRTCESSRFWSLSYLRTFADVRDWSRISFGRCGLAETRQAEPTPAKSASGKPAGLLPIDAFASGDPPLSTRVCSRLWFLLEVPGTLGTVRKSSLIQLHDRSGEG